MLQKILLAVIMTFALNLFSGIRSSESSHVVTKTHLAEILTVSIIK